MQKALSFLKPHSLLVGIALALMLTELAVELMQPLLIAKIIDDGILKQDLRHVWTWGTVMIGLTALSFAAGMLNSFYAAHVSQSFSYDTRKGLFQKIQSFSYSTFGQFSSSSYITRLTNDVTQVQNMIFMGLRFMLRAPLMIAGGIVLSLAVNVKLGFFLLVTIPILILFLLWVLKKGGALFRSVQKRLDQVNTVMQENLTAMKLIKALLRGSHEVKRFIKANTRLMEKTVSAFQLVEFTMPVLMLLMNLCILLILWAGASSITSGGTQVGDVVAIINYATRMTGALSMFPFLIMIFTRAKASGDRIGEVLETEGDEREEGVISERLSGRIVFQHVSFRYPDMDREALRDVSFSVNPRERIAILGATGSGKSTLFQLIPRLYQPDSGRIYIDEKPIRDVPAEGLRKQIGYVPQEVLLFSGTIKENIAWGKENASLDEIMEAAKHAQIHETIMKLPNGYDTVLGQRGVNLSGGQKQRISIARALIRKPAILLLDDSTSALDLQTEAKLLEAVSTYECTTLIITQKMTTAMKADQILLLEDGELIEKGTHSELLSESHLYKRIYESQFGREGSESC
ncbi:ABC transporter ATP-binding protein [Bacillus vallismortis]|uniref:ABC transporter ATP-binding protein n=1 Tax=Bacillus vallismortis TaxID=72361 RepID=UPI000287ED22|nr:ABC transporter ATP-binding protein [Bacillus vallismortis]MBG9770219.1 ABC transporter ATP-binding protein [Bacillus vallismortis]MCY8545478.1 ABC transporter ATP-binding protein/permease [Bacillus vallismortis]MEC1270353.1 ABC transporter ATP-binding protein [Bacillus vallismortis]MEC1651991.1 ABC transporter ATP-binding protein [Bacillus vallismortis]QAV09632.1 ABC transporter ATP-binding protein [Bacillus vallismortis]